MRVFLSYRSEDTRHEAKQIRRDLEKLNIGLKPFEYKTSTPAGAEWEDALRENLLQSDVLIALIGKKWLDLLQHKDPKADKVRYEIGTALDQGIRVIPLLVAGADMPNAKQLPKDLRRLAKCMAIHRYVLKDLVKQICRVSNWVIVSDRSPFTKTLRDALMEKSEQLRIVRCPKFALKAEQHHVEYPRLLAQFMNEAPHGSWLFTNYPEDERNKRPPDEESLLIKQLLRQKKRMICFESGHNLWRRARKYIGNGNNPVGVIETHAGHAIEQLIRHMTTHVWRKDDIGQIEIVSVMGPRAANTQERGRKYLEFFGCVQHGLKTHQYETVCNDLGTKVLCTTVTQPLPTWLAEDCMPEIRKFLQLRKPNNKSVHTTFVCGNDDLALLVYKAVSTKFSDDVKQGRVSFVGFDGMPCMDKMKRTLKSRAATAEVNFNEMVRIAGGWLSDGKVPTEPWPVSALVRP